MVVLHGDEFVPVVSGGDVLQGLEFPGCHLRTGRGLLEWELSGGGSLGWKEGARRTELAPMYRTFPLSTTSFNAFMISSLGVSRSRR